MRSMKQFEKMTDKELWANVMINHVQRVKKVVNQMKSQGRLNEVNSYEGIERMLGIKVTESPIQKSSGHIKSNITSNKTLDIVNRQSNYHYSKSKNPLESFGGVSSKRNFLATVQNGSVMQNLSKNYFSKRSFSMNRTQENTTNQVSFANLPLFRDESCQKIDIVHAIRGANQTHIATSKAFNSPIIAKGLAFSTMHSNSNHQSKNVLNYALALDTQSLQKENVKVLKSKQKLMKPGRLGARHLSMQATTSDIQKRNAFHSTLQSKIQNTSFKSPQITENTSSVAFRFTHDRSLRDAENPGVRTMLNSPNAELLSTNPPSFLPNIGHTTTQKYKNLNLTADRAQFPISEEILNIELSKKQVPQKQAPSTNQGVLESSGLQTTLANRVDYFSQPLQLRDSDKRRLSNQMQKEQPPREAPSYLKDISTAKNSQNTPEQPNISGVMELKHNLMIETGQVDITSQAPFFPKMLHETFAASLGSNGTTDEPNKASSKKKSKKKSKSPIGKNKIHDREILRGQGIFNADDS